jgi:PHYB activation tagged suppressor 1
MAYGWLLSAAASAALASWAFDALVRLVWRPRAVERRLRAQGVRGPGYGFFHGNLRAAGAGVRLAVAGHDFTPIAQPQFREWVPRYGRVFLYWFGATPNICVADHAVAKQVLADRTGTFIYISTGKQESTSTCMELFGLRVP